MKGIISMSVNEVDRIGVLEAVKEKRVKQKHAAKQLGISVRQIRRIMKKYKTHGAVGLVHKLRGKVSNRAFPREEKTRMTTLIQANYVDFGPTLAWEKLTEYHSFHCSDEMVRQVMIEQGLWKVHRRRTVHLHQLRERRECLGEMVQADGSPHDWFEGRAPKCTLLVFIDDATSKLLWLEFVKSESTKAYFVAVRHYLERHGRPVTFYVDKHGVFRVNTAKGGSADTHDSNGLTQFGRAMEELLIGCIFAESAEAKGRVEKVNRTLQDRLVKEMRLLGISSWEAGNAYLPEFMETFNGKFAVTPKSPVNLHRLLLPEQNLDTILCIKNQRILSKQLTLSYESRIYQITENRPFYALRHAPVVVEENVAGDIRILYKGEPLSYTIFKQQQRADIVDSKDLNAAVDHLCEQLVMPEMEKQKQPWIPPKDHPWRRYQQKSN